MKKSYCLIDYLLSKIQNIMKKLATVIIISVFSFVAVYSQGLVDIKNTSTCETALDISRFMRFGPTTAPEVYGTASTTDFDRPKHPTWYKFTASNDGVLLFDVFPQESKDNYDFLLFKDEPNFCEKYTNKQISPIRSNFAPSDIQKSGYTGLSFKGEGDSYEKGVEVKKGDKFYLALNNLYAEGKGHTIVFKYLKILTIKGNIASNNNTSVKAKIKWKSLRSDDITVVSETKKKGAYEIKATLRNESHSFPKYELCVTAEKYFPEFKIFSTKEANLLNGKQIDFKLSKIKKGLNNESLGIIYFMANEDATVPEADIILKKLLITMRTNKKTEITLEGHTNGLYPTTDLDIELSKNRANSIKKYLTDNGISLSRINTKGYGSKREKFPTPKDEIEEGFNRRVEVFFDKI